MHINLQYTDIIVLILSSRWKLYINKESFKILSGSAGSPVMHTCRDRD